MHLHACVQVKMPGEAGDVGFKQAMQVKWLAMDRSGGEPRVVRKVDAIEDRTQALLKGVAEGKEVSKADAENLQKKRKLIRLEQWKTYKLSKGVKFALERKKQATDLTAEMLAKGTWRTAEFKDYNFNAMGAPPAGGHLHPLLKVRVCARARILLSSPACMHACSRHVMARGTSAAWVPL